MPYCVKKVDNQDFNDIFPILLQGLVWLFGMVMKLVEISKGGYTCQFNT